jgi:hypothetical protein
LTCPIASGGLLRKADAIGCRGKTGDPDAVDKGCRLDRKP